MTASAKPKTKKPAKPAKKTAKPKSGRAAINAEPAAPTAPTTPEVVALTALDLTVAKAVRAGTDAEAVERYKIRYSAKEPMPPLECTGTRNRPDTPIWVGDGGHRALALMEAGKSSAECLVWWFDTPEEAESKAWEIAYAGNTSHGLPRTKADLDAAIRSALLREPAASSDRAIADKLHCHRTPVMKVRVRMTEAGELTGKASAEGRYKESEYQQWVTGKGERPKTEPKAETATISTPPSTPVVSEPADGWRSISLGDVELDVKVEGELAKRGIRTVGDLADAMEDERANDLTERFTQQVWEELIAVVDQTRQPVDRDEPAGVPVVGTATGPVVVRDEKGRPVPADLLPVFEQRTTFRSLSQRVGALLNEYESLASSPAGAAVQIQPARQDANSLSRGVAGAMPYVVCPTCGGSGVQGSKPCPSCVGVQGEKKGRGWVCRLRFDQFTPELKAVCDGPWDTTTEG